MLESTVPHGAPYWSPFAIACGVVIGLLVGSIVTGLFALHLARGNRVRVAVRPDPATAEIEIHPETLAAPWRSSFRGVHRA